MTALGRRLAVVERREVGRRTDRGPAIRIVWPDAWSAADRVTFDEAAAAGDQETRQEVVARYAGRRPGAGTTVIAIRVRADGPA